jgi:predicted AAA+ superfamily ATPase
MMINGGYPRLYAYDLAPQEWYPGYIDTYVERDVRQIQNILDLSTFRRFVKLCSGRIGQVLNVTSLANDCGVSAPTINAWLSLLETSYIVFLLQPYCENFNKRLIKSPKLYFYDTGLACSLLSIQNAEQLFTHYSRGHLFENFVITELMKTLYNQGDRPNMYFWRDKVGHEIDCIIEHAGTVKVIEIKASATMSSSFFTELTSWQKRAGTSSGQNYVVYTGSDDTWSYGRVVGWKNIATILE